MMSQIEEQCGCGASITLPSSHTNTLTEWRGTHQHEPPPDVEKFLTPILEALTSLLKLSKASTEGVALLLETRATEL